MMKTFNLTTAEAVMRWAMDSVDTCGDYRGGQETAAYLAECVRLREALDALEAGYNANNGLLETAQDVFSELRDAMKAPK
jgi:hypothetical protein